MSIINDLKMKIAKLETKIDKIQDECSHPRQARESAYKANTGNYDPSADYYWIEHYCTLCEKKWNTEQ